MPEELPNGVRRTLELLRKRHRHYVAIKRIRKGFYAYETTTVWDAAKGRYRSPSIYLGKIEEDGRFVAAVRRKGRAGKGTMPGETDRENPLNMGRYDEAILKILSMNGRATLSTISRLTGLSKSAVAYNLKRIEKKYDVRYTLDMRMPVLGFTEYIILVKFLSKSPEASKVRALLQNFPNIQYAAFTSGEYNLFAYMLARDNSDVIEILYNLRLELKDYISEWYYVPFSKYYGQILLRDDFFEVMTKNVWNRTREKPRPTAQEITKREFLVLRELNSNCRREFSDINFRHGFKGDGAQYTYRTMRERRKLIKRPTISIGNTGSKYTAIIFMDDLDVNAFQKGRPRFLEYLTDDVRGPVNRFALEGDIGMPDSILMIAPIPYDGYLQEMQSYLYANVSGVRLRTLIVTDTIIGELGFKKFDNMHTGNYKILVQRYKTRTFDGIIDYENESTE